MNECLQLKKSNCKNCYKCIRHCPVKSIRFSDNQANIINEDCILCGRCFAICPQGAKQIRNDINIAKNLITEGRPVIASVAPSFIANFNISGFGAIKDALLKIGFTDAEETAIGATIVKKEYEKIIKSGEKDVIISSCCPSVNTLIQKYYPEALAYLADVVSPMQAHCRLLKQQYQDAYTVFIGPCISKKAEADKDSFVDCVLTYEELSEWMESENVSFSAAPATEHIGKRASFFPTAGGIIRSMYTENTDYKYITIDGVEKCIEAIKEIINGKIHHCFIEMSACEGSCIGGPVMASAGKANRITNEIRVNNYAGDMDFEITAVDNQKMQKSFEYIGLQQNVMPGESEIKRILAQIGKTKPEHELNCGSCGYNTCREKAIAVCLGKADMSMCLPFLKEKAESFSDKIINNTPNAIIVMDSDLNVQQINKAACELFNIKMPTDVLNSPVVRLLDPTDYVSVISDGKNIYYKRHYISEYNKYVEETIVYDRDYHLIISVMHDITKQEIEKAQKEERGRQAVEITDKVIEKQMRVVQDIASLLGETTAETQIALTKLKETLKQ